MPCSPWSQRARDHRVIPGRAPPHAVSSAGTPCPHRRDPLRAELARSRDDRDSLSALAFVDELTGLANRRAFRAAILDEWGAARRTGVDSWVVVLDLDGFKALNDRHGHAAGDEALSRFALALRAAARDTDLAARLGGDEFALLLPRCGEPVAAEVARRLDRALAGELSYTAGHASLLGASSAATALDIADRMMLTRKTQRPR